MPACLPRLAGAIAIGLFGSAEAGLTARLHDGTILHGEPIGWDGEARTIALQSVLSEQPIALPFDRIDRLEPDTEATETSHQAIHTVVQLSNGDRLRGELKSFALDRAVLLTPFGEIAVDPAMIRTIRRDDNGKVVFRYTGPADASLWHGNQVSYSEEGFRIGPGQPLVASVQLPSSYRLTLELDRPLAELSLGIDLHVGPGGEVEYNCPPYLLVISPGGALRAQSTVNHRGFHMQAEEPQQLEGKPERARSPCRLEIQVDRHEGLVLVRANDGPPVVIENLPAFPELGSDLQPGVAAGIHHRQTLTEMPSQTSLRLTNTNRSDQALLVSEFSIEGWSGMAGGLPSHSAHAGSAKEERAATLNLVNGDVLWGHLTKIEDEFYHLEIDGVLVPVARDRVVELEAPSGTNEPRRRRNDLRIRLAEDMRLTLSLDELRDGKLVGTSDNFAGSLEIPLARCLELEANLYRNLLPPLNPTASADLPLDLFVPGAPAGGPQARPIFGLPVDRR